MAIFAVDSDGHPLPDLLPDNYVTILGYTRNVTGAHVAQAHAAGIGFGLIFEYAPDDPVRGWNWGDFDARKAVAQLATLGAPAGVLVWFTCDRDTPPNLWPIVADYCRAAAPIMHAAGYRAGMYCGEDLADWLLDRGLVDGTWGTGATSWNHGHRSDRLMLRQHAGPARVGNVAVDVNSVLQADHGQWASSPATQPNPTPPAAVAGKKGPAMFAFRLSDTGCWLVYPNGAGVLVRAWIGDVRVWGQVAAQIVGPNNLALCDAEPNTESWVRGLPEVVGGAGFTL